jgi:hypothetical protein
MKIMDIAIAEEKKSLKGKDFVAYCLFDHPDKEFRKNVHALYYAVVYDIDKTEKYIRRIIGEPDKSLIWYYPAHDNADMIKGKEFVGTVLDGGLYFG